jgi:hypothetical protein
MNLMRQFGSFWYHFIVGDDWRIALGVLLGLGLTYFITHGTHIQAWWLLPTMVITMLTLSLWLAIRNR